MKKTGSKPDKLQEILHLLEQREAELSVINSVQEGLVADMDMQGIYDLVGDRIRDLFDAQVVMIATFSHKDKTEQLHYMYEDGKRIYPEVRKYNNTRQNLIDSRELILINSNAIEAVDVVPGTALPKSMLFVPLVIGTSVNGYVSLQNLEREYAFSESDVRLLGTLTNSMSVALENARLFNETTRLLAETEQRNGELAIINSVQEGLVREMDLGTIYSLVGDRICEVLNTETLVIRTFDHEKELEKWEYAVENGTHLYADPRPIIWANKRIIQTKTPLLINEKYVETAMKYGGKGFTKGMPPKSAIFMPMIVGDEVIGSVALQNVEREHAYSESDVRLLTTLTNSMSVALENARLFNETTRLLAETEQRAGELDTVNRVSRALVAQLDFKALINMVGELMQKTFEADIVYMGLYDREANMLHFPYNYGEEIESRPFGSGFTEKIISKEEPLLINRNIEEVRNQLEAEQIGKLPASYLGVPVQKGSEVTGVISVQSFEENRFDENDLRLLSTIAANVGIAMQNAEAYEKLRAAMSKLEATQEQLVKQEKLASLGQLTAGIAHEIKNPLNFVNNFSDLSIELIQEISELAARLDPSDTVDEMNIILRDVETNLKKIHEHGSRTDSIVKSMLQHSRGGTGKKEPTDLNALVREFTNLAYHGMRAGPRPINVDMELVLGEDIGETNLIKEDFSRVLLNLMNNAFDAMWIKMKEGKDKKYLPKFHISTRRDYQLIQIDIRDNGTGIPEEIREKILQPFFTTKKGTEGTGLGLSITNDIVEAHGGTLEFESDDTGTLFTIKLNSN